MPQVLVSLEIASTAAVASGAARSAGAALKLEREQAASLSLLQRTVSESMVDLESLVIEVRGANRTSNYFERPTGRAPRGGPGWGAGRSHRAAP